MSTTKTSRSHEEKVNHQAKTDHKSSGKAYDFSPFKSFDSLFHGNFKGMTSPNMDFDSMLKSHKCNLESLQQVQQTATDLMKDLTQLNTQYMRYAFDDMGKQPLAGALKPGADNIDQGKKALKEACDKALSHYKEMTSLLTQSTEKIFNVYKKRFKEGLDETHSAISKAN